MAKSATTTSATTAEAVEAKATTKTMVANIDRFAEVKAEITRLTKEKEALAELIEAEFGSATLLTHYGVEVARLDWRGRTGTDEALLKSVFPEAYEATRKTTTYSVIVNIFRRK
jgi:hypothetical protein